ncbi:MAG: MFS transporter [Lentisphaerae bacterium]|nr:MFS transporter [Lentisphaerota bacterium]
MKYIFYLLPGLLNIVISLFSFITTKRLADAGASSFAVTSAIPTWAVTYTAASFLIGRWASRENAVKLTIFSQIILTGSMIGLLFSTSVDLQYLWLVLSGLGTGLFFVPFQAVVKLFEKEELSAVTFARSTAIYTASWSSGQAVGPLIAALLWGCFDPAYGWRYCYMVCVVIVSIVILTLIIMNKFIRQRLQEERAAQQSSDSVRQSQANTMPDVMLTAWILALGGMLALTAMRSYLPDFATKELALPVSSQGIMLGVLSLTQALTALSCIKTRKWPYRPWGGSIGAAAAVAAMLTLTVAGSSVAAWAATGLFGIFSGIFCYNMTYHALANARHSARYAAVNETIVGSMSILAPLGAGFLADTTNARMPFYLLAATTTLTAVIFIRMLWQHRKI